MQTLMRWCATASWRIEWVSSNLMLLWLIENKIFIIREFRTIFPGNFVRFLSILHRERHSKPDSLLPYACLHLIARMRLEALDTMHVAFKAPTVRLKVDTVAEWLKLPEFKEAEKVLKECKIEVKEGVIFPGQIDKKDLEKVKFVHSAWYVL